MKRSIDNPAGYLERLRPLYVRLFRVAHMIVGNLELSEYVLRSAIVEAYLRRGEWQGRMGFQDSLTHTVKTVALVELKGMRAAGSFETDWTFPVPELSDASQQALLSKLLREEGPTPRIALLFYGADLGVKQIAQALELRVGDVSARLRKLDSRLMRSLRLKGRRAEKTLDEAMELLCRAALSVPGEDVAEMGAVFRSFERDVDGAKKPRASTARIAGTALKALCALVLAALIWLMAVLLEPKTVHTPPATMEHTQNTTDL